MHIGYASAVMAVGYLWLCIYIYTSTLGLKNLFFRETESREDFRTTGLLEGAAY